MANLSGDISHLVYRKIMRADLGKVSLDGQTLNILMQLDGQKNLSQIADASGMSMEEIKDSVSKLIEWKLIEPADEVSTEFYDQLKEQLSLAVGPIAEVIIEDVAEEMEIELPSIPMNRAAEMVENLSGNIPREEKRLAFQSAMLEIINEMT